MQMFSTEKNNYVCCAAGTLVQLLMRMNPLSTHQCESTPQTC